VFFAVAAPAVADDNADANRLFVEAMQAWKQAEQLTGDSREQAETRLELLQEIEANLNRIVEEHSSSDLAVQLLLGPVGPLELDRLPRLIEGAEASVFRFRVAELILAGDIRNAQRGLALNAIQAAQTLETAFYRSMALTKIARAQAKAGDVLGAFQTAQMIEDVFIRSRALSGISEVQAKAGDVSGALETAQMIEDAHERSVALNWIARAQAEASQAEASNVSGAQVVVIDDVSEALATAQMIEDADERSLALRAIAEAQAEAGDLSGSLVTAQTIENDFHRSMALASILESSAALVPR
jgi:replicative superfamily II helicase